MLSFARHTGHAHFLSPQKSINHTGFTHIGIARQTNLNPFLLRVLLKNVYELLRRQHCACVFLDMFLSFNYWTFLSSKKAMVHSYAFEILIPLLSDFYRDQVALVDNKQKLVLPYLTCIGKEILTKEKERVSGIDDLDQNIAPFDHSPKLSPNFQILFIGSNWNVIVLFFDFCQSPPPA